MFNLNKKSGFTLAEILITLGLVGAISALTIPTLAYNYKSKVLEEQFRSTYSDIKQIGAYFNYEKGDVGDYARRSAYTEFFKEFMSKVSGGNSYRSTTDYTKAATYLRELYQSDRAPHPPYRFNRQVGRVSGSVFCDNYGAWIDSKGRIWTFNAESRTICVDINGSAKPNTYNIDIFAFMPMRARDVAEWIYNDAGNGNDYSGQIVLCDADKLAASNINNTDWSDQVCQKGNGCAYDTCPYNYPVENIAPAGKSAKGKTVTSSNNYWNDYIDYK